MTEYKLNLHLFDGAEGGGAPVGGAEAAAAADSGAAGQGQTAQDTQQESAEARKARYEAQRAALSQEFSDLDEAYMQSQFGRRMKAAQDEAKTAKAQLEAFSPMLTTLAARYGLDASDPAAIAEAVEADASFLEDVAAEKGMSVPEYKEHMAQRKELDELRAFKKRTEDQQDTDRRIQLWKQQEQQAQATFPGLNLAAELEGPQGEDMLKLLYQGWPVEQAYKMLHVDDLVSGAMQRTAQDVRKKTVDDIRANGMRPPEGGRSASAVSTRVDVSKLTKAQRDEYARRAERGERITFT